MLSDEEKEVKEVKPSKQSKKSIRKRLGLEKKSSKKDGKSSRSKSSDINNNSGQGSIFSLNNNNNNDDDESGTKLIDVNDSIASDATNPPMTSAASIATTSSEKRKDRVDRVSREARRVGKGVMKRVRSLSRSRRRERFDSDTDTDHSSSSDGGSGRRSKSTVVTVTSCRSDGYYNQKAPGSTSKLPRKAPTNLKLFHELAVGLKDAFTAVGQTPTKPELEQEMTDEATGETRMVQVMSEQEFAGRTVLWDFMGNIDFVRKNGQKFC